MINISARENHPLRQSCSSNWSSKHSFAASVTLSLFFVTVWSFSSQFGGDGTNDDFAIGVALSNRLPEADMSLFVNALFGYMISSLNSVIPDVNWFWFIERLSVFVSFSTLLFICFEKSEDYPLLFLAPICFCSLLLVGCTYRGNFSFVASAATLSGGMALVLGLKSPYSRRYNALLTFLAIALLLIGFSIRIESFLLFVPFLLLSIGGTLLAGQNNLAVIARKLRPIFLTVVCCFILFAIDQAIWNSNDDLYQWKQYNHVRSQISDYPMPQYGEVSDTLLAYGVSENDYFMLQNWMTADTSVFDYETLSKVASLSEQRSLIQQIQGIPNAAKDYFFRLTTEGLLLGFIVLYGLLIAKSKKSRLFSGSLLFLAFILSSYLVATGRFPQRVEYPLWVYAFSIVSLEITGIVNIEKTRLQSAIQGITVFIFLFSAVNQLPLFSIHEVKDSITQTTCHAQGEVFDYERNHPQDVYLFDVGTYEIVEQTFKEKNLPSTEFLTHNATLGGWSCESPYFKSRNRIMGSSSLLKELATNESFHLLTRTPSICDTLCIFLQEHYGLNAKAKVSKGPTDAIYQCDFECVN